MGADLIGFMVSGPRNLPSKSVCTKWYDACKNKDGCIVVQEQDEEQCLDEIIFSKKEFEEFIDSFYKFWPGNARDSYYREFSFPDVPDFVVVFAGDSSWGDEPEGHGYEMLKTMLALSLSEILGIK